MINWISCEDEKDVKKIDFNNLCKIMKFIKNEDSKDEMVNYVSQIFNEYEDVISGNPGFRSSF